MLEQYDFVLWWLLLPLNKLPPFSEIFIANFEHVFVSSDFISHERPVTGPYIRIIYGGIR